MMLLPIKRHVGEPLTAGTEYREFLYIYSNQHKEINSVLPINVAGFKQRYFDNPIWYVQ